MAYTTIDDPTKFFSTNLWVADNASSRSLTGFGHQPDLVWTKHRDSGATNPTFTDSVRGGDKQMGTPSNAAEDSGSHGKISSFDSDGITVIDGTNATYPRLYFNSLNPFGASVGGNYVGWSWKAGGSSTTNPSGGTITTTASVNTTAGFSVFTYTGNGSAAHLAHGLGVAPTVVIIKGRSNSDHWFVKHPGIAANEYIYLNNTGAKTSGVNAWSATNPDATKIYVGTDGGVNGSGTTYVCYAFAEKKGYSKFGSYTGNGNADGAFVYTGFKPAFIFVKGTSVTSDWTLLDNKRNTFNVVNAQLQANKSDAESSANSVDFTAQGFKVRNQYDSLGSSGNTYIYMAFAEAPFVTAGTKAAGTAR